MQRLKDILDKYAHWSPYREYLDRIEAYSKSDFSLCVENAKALLEGICKEICQKNGIELEKNSKMNGLLKTTFKSLGYAPSSTIQQIGTSLATVGQHIGNFRNEIGTTSHGKTVNELTNRQNLVNELTGNFLINSTDIICCLLIESFESNSPIKSIQTDLDYNQNQDFNEWLDDQYGEFEMGPYSFLSSEILFNNDPAAYKTEYSNFKLISDEADNRE